MHRAISLDVCDYTNTLVCNLYDSTNDISGQATNVVVHTERNGFKELRFSLPSVTEDGEKNYRLDWLIADYKIRLRSVKTNTNTGEKTTEIDWFLISESKVVHNNFSMNYDIKASHISQLLNTKNLGLEFSDDEGNNTGTIKEIATTILDGTGWHLGYVETFYEEDKYTKSGVKKEKVRSFTASAKTGAFKMMNDLCEMFDAKPIYHGEGVYKDEDGNEQIGRTVDITSINPFSKDLAEGSVPKEVLEGEGVLALYYDKNVRNITRTLNTDHLVTVLSAYGSYGDVTTGLVSLQTCEHAEITFGALGAGTYHFEYLDGQYYFTTNKATNGLKWSYIDFISRTYVFDGTNLFKVTKNAPQSYTTITGALKYVTNQLSFIMDFSYYQKISLLTDEHLLSIAQAQWNLPQKYIQAQNASLALSTTKSELSRTTFDGGGFLMFDIESKDMNKGNLRLKLKKSDEHPDAVIFRSDYDEAVRNRFSWLTAVSISSKGQALSGRGAVFYIVHNTMPTTWDKVYLKAVGTEEYDYYRDELNNIYTLVNEIHRDHKSYEASDPGGTYFPTTGSEGYIYVADDTKKMYAWVVDKYTEIKASAYYYGLNEFEYPDTVTLWTTNNSAWRDGDKVYMFSSDSIAGVFGPKEDQINSNQDSINNATKSAGTVEHPVVFINQGDTAPSIDICGENGYAWYYVSPTSGYDLGELYFCYRGAGDNTWGKVYISDSPNDGEEVAKVSGYNYYYSRRRQFIYKLNGNKYVRMDKSLEEQTIKGNFKQIVQACYKHEELSKGTRERFNYSDTLSTLNGNYAFKVEYDTYYLFSTGKTIISDPSKVYYDVDTQKVWIDNDQEHILNSTLHTSDVLTFKCSNELDGLTYVQGDFVNNVLKTTGDKQTCQISEVFEKTVYEFSLPSGSTVVCQDSKGTVIQSFTTSPFTTPVHTSKATVVCPSLPTASNYLRVKDYDKMFFVSGNGYRILNCTGAGNRIGMNYLMDKFMELAHTAYEIELPLLQTAQKEITNTIVNLSNQLGDMYREGFWQEPKYVEGDEEQLYADALENLSEISHPEATYDISYLDLYGSDNNLSAIVETDWPDVDISYAAHLVDTDIDTNKWAYIDSINKCYDQPWKTEISVNTRLSMIGQQSFTDVLTKIAEVANEVKAKQNVYDRSKYLGSAGKIAADKLEGLIQANKVYLLGGTSNWYTDEKGNIMFEAADGNSVMMLTGRGLCIANSKDSDGNWNYRTAISGLGINADTIAAGEFSAKHIIAGTITTDKLSSVVGAELEISSNKALTLYATIDGERPSGSLLTQHPNEGDSWIQIGAKNGLDPAFIDIQSGGKVNIYGGSSLNLESAGTLNIKSGGIFLVDTPNFKITKNGNNYDVTVTGKIYTTGGTIANWTIASGFIANAATIKTSTVGIGDSTYTLWAGKANTQSDISKSAVYIANNGSVKFGKFTVDTNGNATCTNLSMTGGSINGDDITISAKSVKIKSGSSYISLIDVSNTADTAKSNAATAQSTADTAKANAATAQSTADTAKTNAAAAQSTADSYANGTSKVKWVESTGITIKDNAIDVSATGVITMAANSSLTFKTTSSNTAFVLNNDGVSIGTAKSIALAAGGTFTINSGNFSIGTDGKVTVKGTVEASGGKIANWTIGSNFIANGESVKTSTVGIGDSTYALWAGKGNTETNIANSKVYINKDGSVKFGSLSITSDGKATCSDFSMTGGSISLSSGSINMSGGTIDVNTNNFKLDSANQTVQTGDWKMGGTGIYGGTNTNNCKLEIQGDHLFHIALAPFEYGVDVSMYLTNYKGKYTIPGQNLVDEGCIIFSTSGSNNGHGCIGSENIPIKELWSHYVCYWSLNAQSSKKLKHDIKSMPNIGDVLDLLEPVTFKYNRFPNETRYGLIYEDTVKILPEICTEANDGTGAINYVELVPMLLKETQELRKRVAKLEKCINKS